MKKDQKNLSLIYSWEKKPFIIQIPLDEEARADEVIRPPGNHHPDNQEENEQQQEFIMAALAKNFPVFAGKKSEDADIHVSRFEHYWKVARPRDPNPAAAALEELKRDAFINTFSKGATEWISRYNENHFNTYALLVAAFLQRFRKEKSSSQLCSNIRELQQGRMDVEAYASKILSMRQRVEEQLRPTIKQTTEWFINGLKPECHASVNTENAETEEEFDAIVEKAKIAERREQEKKRTRRRKEKTPAEDDTSASSESSSSESKKEDKKKNKKQGKTRKSEALGEMQTLLEELKKAKNEVVRRNMFCSQCRMEGHVKEECTTPPTCAICEMYNHSTSNCRYNMRNRAAAVNQVEAQPAQDTPGGHNRGRGRFRGRGIPREQYRERPSLTCYYCQVSGHTSRDCPLRIRHQAEKQAEIEKSQNNPADVQMISMDEERSQVTKMLDELTEVLTVTRAQAKKKPQQILKKG